MGLQKWIEIEEKVLHIARVLYISTLDPYSSHGEQPTQLFTHASGPSCTQSRVYRLVRKIFYAHMGERLCTHREKWHYTSCWKSNKILSLKRLRSGPQNIQNPVNTNELCYSTIKNISNSTKLTKFLKRPFQQNINLTLTVSF